MGMGIGAAHDGPLVLKDLNPLVFSPQFAALILPGPDHRKDLLLLHLWQGQVMPGVEADHAAGSGDRLLPEEITPVPGGLGGLGEKRREIIVENKGARVGRVDLASGSGVAGT